jgi:Rod binding domain-containing protein
MLSIAAVTAVGAGANASSTTPSPRLIHAAHEFEAQMMKELLKPMTAGNGLDGNAATGSGSALEEFGSEALARGLSEQGGFGIANSIVRQLSSASNQKVTSE